MLLLSTTTSLPYRYRLYGQVLAAVQPLGGLSDLAVPADTEIDIRIHVGNIPEPETSAYDGQITYAITEQAIYLAYPNVGRFVIQRDGLGVAPDPAAPEQRWQRWLLGPMLGLWLQRHGQVVLHANAVALSGQAFLILGDSGKGKTTLTRALLQQGAHLITDDVSVLDIPLAPDTPITIAPGPPWLKLTDATWAAFQPTPFAPGMEGKASLAVSSRCHVTTAMPVAALFVLSVGTEVACAAMGGADAVLALQRHAHMARALSVLGTASQHFEQSGRLAQHLPCFALQRSRSLADLPHLLDAVLNVAAAVTP